MIQRGDSYLKLGMLTECFRRDPISDLRTPRSTFDSFCRSVLTEQPAALWPTVHPELRYMMQKRIALEGDEKFFTRMKRIINNSGGRLCLGQADMIEPGKMSCPVLRSGRKVGTAGFDFYDRSWVLSSLE
jgi:hypothetical protein